MSNSSMVVYTQISPNKNSTRVHSTYNPKGVIDKITIHHMAGNLSIETCGNVFAPTSRQASSNYGIGTDGRVGMYVEEHHRSWCSSSPANDYRSVTIEVANSSTGGDWPVSDAALNALIELCADICKRNGFSLNYDGTKNGSLTKHNMFSNTTCPGPYLESKYDYIVQQVNAKLGVSGSTSSSTSTSSTSTASTSSKSDTIIKVHQGWYNSIYSSKTGFKIAEDGYKGPNTKKAFIMALQIELNKLGAKLTVDGIWGSNTEAAVKKYIALKNGSKGNLVHIWQFILYCNGWTSLAIDEAFGTKTATATGEFQSKNGLTVDKVAGVNSFKKGYAGMA